MNAIAPKHMNEGALGNDFIAFIADEVTKATVGMLAMQKGWPEERIMIGGILEAIERLKDVATPSRMLIDLGEAEDPLAAVNALAEICEPGSHVVLLGSINDIALYRTLTEFGVDDYLVKPVSADQIEAAFARRELPVEPQTTRSSKIDDVGDLYVVTGVRGGIGASTIALNIGWILAHEWDRNVALADLDLQFGTASLMLDLEPGTGLLEALANPDRIDDLFMERAIVRESEKLALLSAEEPLDHSPHLDNDSVEILTNRLRRSFDRVVIDVPRSVLCGQSGLVEAATSVVVVTDLSLAGLRDSMRLIDAVITVAPTTEVVLVASQVGINPKGELSIKDFEAGVGRSIDFSLPWDQKAITMAATAAKPLCTGDNGSEHDCQTTPCAPKGVARCARPSRHMRRSRLGPRCRPRAGLPRDRTQFSGISRRVNAHLN